jgi:phage tail sheath protein FI
MPVPVSYPGVYIEEVPSGVRTITGVSTSIAAFLGWSARGPIDRAQRVLSFSDFTRTYGGLDPRSLLGYSVQQFFANGGQDAYIVRIADAAAAAAQVDVDGTLTFTAQGPGDWGEDYGIATTIRADDATRFRVAVVYKPDTDNITVETFENLSVAPTDPRFVVGVINAASTLVTVALIGTPASPPANTAATAAKLAAGADGTVLGPDDAAFKTAIDPLVANSAVGLLDHVDLFNLLCVPGEHDATAIGKLQKYCHDRRAFLIVDCPPDATLTSMQAAGALANQTGPDAFNSAFYFPWLQAPDAAREQRLELFPPCGFVAGIYARTDATRGVWKAPAGSEAGVSGAVGVAVPLTDKENGTLNPKGINCIRTLPVYGTVVWGSRTLHGADERGSEWKYVPVRRIALYIEESLFRGTQWVVFEPNDEPLWAQIRLNVGAFMHSLFRQGAFAGATPRDAYFVKCDKETTTPNDVNSGIVNIVVGFAPLKPAEFVVIKIQQISNLPPA